jgi:hypothetical protein
MVSLRDEKTQKHQGLTIPDNALKLQPRRPDKATVQILVIKLKIFYNP